MAEIKEVRRLTELETYYRIELPGGEDLGPPAGAVRRAVHLRRGRGAVLDLLVAHAEGRLRAGRAPRRHADRVLLRLQPGTKVGIRGPFGNGIDVEKFKGKDVLIVAGGIGLVPMRSMINYVIDNRDEFGRLIICYGSKSDRICCSPTSCSSGTEDPAIDYHVTVDQGSRRLAGQDRRDHHPDSRAWIWIWPTPCAASAGRR